MDNSVARANAKDQRPDTSIFIREETIAGWDKDKVEAVVADFRSEGAELLGGVDFKEHEQ